MSPPSYVAMPRSNRKKFGPQPFSTGEISSTRAPGWAGQRVVHAFEIAERIDALRVFGYSLGSHDRARSGVLELRAYVLGIYAVRADDSDFGELRLRSLRSAKGVDPGAVLGFRDRVAAELIAHVVRGAATELDGFRDALKVASPDVAHRHGDRHVARGQALDLQAFVRFDHDVDRAS